MLQAAEHPAISRDYPVIADSLKLAASQQLRNMASLGGNVLQRTRCNYFRDVSWTACNKRDPGSGCAAIDGFNRRHAILGASDRCGAWTRRSLYLKVRDRESYDFALASAAVALDLEDGIAREARIGLGGVATIPWRAREAEAALRGERLGEQSAQAAAEAAFANAQTREHNAYKAERKRRLPRLPFNP